MSMSSLTHTRGVEPLDYDFRDVHAFEASVIATLRRLVASHSVDGETLRALDVHLATGQAELDHGLDVQRTHHTTVATALVDIASGNFAAANKQLEEAQVHLDRATRTRQNLEAKLERHDPEGNNHV
ncbi:hypothetical protein [uncultured Amnibacterium sp.]|uniref:hypothetical protein n=1 Tax=uncultured Amnibacterium sp. TaxID=1631851 RepID=UPI0035C9C824